MIQGIFNSSSMPVVEKMVQFTGARHQVLTHNIANLSTPHFRPRDLDPRAFQAQTNAGPAARGAGFRSLFV